MTKRKKPRKPVFSPLEVQGVEIFTWCPDLEAKEPPEQVHMILDITSFDYPIVMRFKSPDTIGSVIKALADHRKEVWPDAKGIDL